MSDFSKALSIFHHEQIVYACQVNKKNCGPSVKGRYLFQINGETHEASRGEWLVWWPEKIQCAFLSDQDFSDRFTLCEFLPPALKLVADAAPDYEAWVEQCDRNVPGDKTGAMDWVAA